MGDGRRLCPLRVRVYGEDGLAVPVGEIEQRLSQIECRRRQPENELALPHPVHRHVDVVAAPRRVESSGRIFAAPVHNQTLDVEE